MNRKKDHVSKKIEPIHITEEMVKDDKMDEMLREEFKKEADQIEKELEENKALKDIKAPDGMLDEIIGKLKREGIWEEDEEEQNKDSKKGAGEKEPSKEQNVYEMLSKEDREALRLGKEIIKQKEREKQRGQHRVGVKGRKRIKRAAVAAAVLVCLVGVSVNTEAGKGYFARMWNAVTGNELTITIDSDQSNIRSLSEQEEEMNQEVQDELGIIPLKLGYMPDGMVFDGYTMNRNGYECIAFYRINDLMVDVLMYKNINAKSVTQKVDGELTDKVVIDSSQIEIPIWKIDSGDGEISYVTQFEFGNGYYFITGAIEEQEFSKVLKNITF